jgi:hypothetical protein
MNIRVCVLSYRRAMALETPAYIPFARVYVDPSEAAAYRKNNPGVKIVECADGVQGNKCRVMNHILDREFKARADVVLLIDDDIQRLERWAGKKRFWIPSEDVLPFIEKYSIMARDLGAYLWGLNVNGDTSAYREYTPFSTTAYIGGPFQAVMRGCTLRYDERFSLKDDYDFTLQHLNKYRCTFRVNGAYYIARQSQQPGGCATYRSIDRERDQLIALQKKWGSSIVQVDTGRKAHMREGKSKGFDYNPIIHVPIGGV